MVFLVKIFFTFVFLSNFAYGLQRTHFPSSKKDLCKLDLDCQPIFLCSNQEELKNDMRKTQFCGWRHNLPMVCCKSSNKLLFKNKNQLDSLELRSKKKNLVKQKKKFNKNLDICGTRIKQISLYVVNGLNVVTKTKWPWFASLVLVKDESYENDNSTNSNLHNYCGASIITDEFLISSAHCFPISGVDDLDLINYRIGVGDIELSKMEIHEIESIIIHPNASTQNHYNDIALIKLKKKLNFNSKIRPICLPFLEDKLLESETNINQKDDFSFNHKDNIPFNNTIKKNSENKFKEPKRNNFNPLHKNNRYGFTKSNFSPHFYGFSNSQYYPNYDYNYDLNNNPQNNPSFYSYENSPFDRNYPLNPYQQYRQIPYQSSNNPFVKIRRSREIVFEKEELISQIFLEPNTKVSIAGFGDTSFGGTRSNILKEASLVIVNHNKCNELYMKLNSPGLKKGLNEEFICAADRTLATKLNSNETLIDPRSPNKRKKFSLIRNKRNINYWIDYFSEKIREKKEKKNKRREIRRNSNKSSLSSSFKNNKNKNEDSNKVKTNKIENNNVDKSEENKKIENYNEDLVNILSEEELNDKLMMSDACQGDSGGPMIAKLDSDILNQEILKFSKSQNESENLKKKYQKWFNIMNKVEDKGLEGKFYLAGVVSLGRNCGDKNYPGVYVNLNYHKNWIQEIVNFDFDNLKFKI